MERLTYRDKDGFPMMKNVVDLNREALSASPPTRTAGVCRKEFYRKIKWTRSH